MVSLIRRWRETHLCQVCFGLGKVIASPTPIEKRFTLTKGSGLLEQSLMYDAGTALPPVDSPDWMIVEKRQGEIAINRTTALNFGTDFGSIYSL
ncbi:hypothetical protein H6F78_11860 [Coleofasciculus sp. FACHB-64]|uniref:hypothetical protein n=1 Tax=Cyanophyceae TaxID=3028117 RepID=UPI001688FDF7|nr:MULTISPECIES: hypothetical protein [unclassified Coleofasciculus]MBD1838027.1 hypothetical protein [Coleofasciculus sp. FACHB-501]MBD2046279.1 hypothetical protein [Coleofasciculus sp. FACHB-64]